MKLFNNMFKDTTATTVNSKTVKTQMSSQVVQDNPTADSAVKVEATSEVDMIEAIFEAENKEMSKEDLKVVQNFIEGTPGSLSEKLETLKMVLQKDIPLSGKHLKQVHLALNFSLPEVIKDHIETSDSKETPDNDKTAKEDVYQKKIFNDVSKILFETLNKGEKLSDNVKVVVGDNKPEILPHSDIIKETQIEIVSDVQVEINEDVPVDYTSEKAVEEVEMDDSFLEPLEMISEMISDLMPESANKVLKFVEVKVTKEMTVAKTTFDVIQKNVVNKLEQITPKNLPVDGKEVLAAVIDKLDHVLMKSDITLYTDMETERDLLSSSSLLDRGRVLIKDQPEKAFEIIQKVQKQIAKISFNPSKEKIFGVLQKEFNKNVQVENEKNYALQLSSDMGVSPRSVLETLRALGINHEVEVSEILNKSDKSAFKSVENMKSILMKLESSSEEKVVKSLDHITGQQLVNKLDVKGMKQHLMFHLPVQTQTDVKDMKIHVNGQKNNQKMDWQNSRLYFVVHLDSIGDTGILVEVHGGQLSMTIKNDSEGLEENMTNIMSEATDRLESVGFVPNRIKFDRLTKEIKEETTKVVTLDEGFDVII